MVTHDRLLEMLSYEPDTGHFRWRVNKAGPGAKVGKIAGNLHKFGYWRVKLDGKYYRAHRLAWFYTHKVWPAFDIDHINGVKHDNRITNLRDVPARLNSYNLQRAHRHNKTGLLGVSFQENRTSFKKYLAKIKVAGKTKCLGSFETPELAHLAYMQAKQVRDSEAMEDHLRNHLKEK